MMTKKTLILAAFVATSGFSLTQAVWGQEPRRGDYHEHEKDRLHEAFALGVCVGKTLTQEGVNIPVAQRGQTTPIDDATRAALHDAVDQCHAELRGEAPPSPSPTVAPSVGPTAEPTGVAPEPTATGTAPVPSPAVSPQMGK